MISFRPTFNAVAVVVLVGGCSIVEVKAGNIRGQHTQTKYNRVLQKEDTGILDGGGEEEGDAGVVSSMTPYEVFLTQKCAAQVFDLGVCLDGGDDDVDSDSESTSLSSRIVVKEDNDVYTNANCYQCIYLLTTIQLSEIDRCVEFCDYVGDTCNQEATALVNCGNGQENTDPTIAPVPDSTDPVPVPVPVPAATDAAADADADTDTDTDADADADTDTAADAAAVADDLSSFVEIPTTAITVGTDSAFPDTDTTTTADVSSSIRKDIPETALDVGLFSTLVTALNATDLLDALSAPNGPYTVFAPTDDAFAALPEGLVGCLLEEDNLSALSNILSYHVVSGQALLSTDVSDSMILPTVFEGHNVGIGVNSADDGTGMLNTGIDVTITINDAATISTANILASNGVIHSLDMVLLPSSIDVIAILNACTTDNNNGGGGDIIGDVAVPESTLEPEPVSSSAATTTTIGDCPETFPNSGDPCTVPTGLSYQTCDSIEGDVLTRCTCRNDGARVFMCTVGSIPPPTAAPIVSPPTSAPVVVPPPITPALVTTAAPVVAPPVSEQTSSSLSLNNNLVPSCYVASLAADGTTYTSNEDKVLPNTGDNCYVAEGLEYGNCVFARDDNPSYYYVIYRCLCNPRELPDDTYLDKFICNIILEEPYRI